MDQIFIKKIRAQGIIGVDYEERQAPQEILISISLFADLHKAGKSDDINLTVNYNTIAKKAKAIAETAQRFTVEALAEDIAQACLAEPLIEKVAVRVEKPSAARFSKSVGVEIERSRA